MTSQLFTPLQIDTRTLSNRITVAPMCQYSAIGGSMTDWHIMHLGSLAISGASMLVIEMTGVTPAAVAICAKAGNEMNPANAARPVAARMDLSCMEPPFAVAPRRPSRCTSARGAGSAAREPLRARGIDFRVNVCVFNAG